MNEMSPIARSIVAVLAVIGAATLIGLVGMTLMHGSMMGGFGC